MRAGVNDVVTLRLDKVGAKLDLLINDVFMETLFNEPWFWYEDLYWGITLAENNEEIEILEIKKG